MLTYIDIGIYAGKLTHISVCIPVLINAYIYMHLQIGIHNHSCISINTCIYTYFYIHS